ncbi:MAG: pantoate--beta-alanine ligase [Candidatus Dormibacteria bacterium]
MEVPRTPAQLRRLTSRWAGAGEAVGLVPTMGSLHRGHLSLVQAARAACERVVVSIFVNPLQFGQEQDYLSYPRQLDSDLAQLAQLKVDAGYCPSVEDIYPSGFATRVEVDTGEPLWEARWRPGHFVGVATVVTKLFSATGPCRAFFGEKDAQQAVLVARLAEDLDLGVEVVVRPTVRDPDGVALSSRNQLLSAGGRRAARCLPRALLAAGLGFSGGTGGGEELADLAAEVIRSEPLAQLDYAGVVDPASFSSVQRASAETRVLVAATVEGVHLIDTALLGAPPQFSD